MPIEIDDVAPFPVQVATWKAIVVFNGHRSDLKPSASLVKKPIQVKSCNSR